MCPCSNPSSGKAPSPTAPGKPTFAAAQASHQTLSGEEPCAGKVVEGPAATCLEAIQPLKQQPQGGAAEQHAANPAPQAPAAATSTAAGAHAEASSGDGHSAAEQQAASPEARPAGAAAAAPAFRAPAEAITGGTQAARAPAPDVSALAQQVQQLSGEIARLQAQAALVPWLQQQIALIPGLQQQVQLLTTTVLAQQQLQQERQGWQQASESLQCKMQELLQIAREGQQPRTAPRPAGAKGRR